MRRWIVGLLLAGFPFAAFAQAPTAAEIVATAPADMSMPPVSIVIVWRCLLALPLLDEIQVFSGSRCCSSTSQSSSLDNMVAKANHLNIKRPTDPWRRLPDLERRRV